MENKAPMSKPSLVNKEISELYPHDYIDDRIKKAEGMINNLKATNYLDIGCSNGVVTKYIAEKLETKNVYGIDIANIEEAKRNTVNAKFHDLNDDLKLPFPDSTFDLITCFDTIEHIYNTDFLIREIRRIIKDDGHAVISIPRTDSFVNIILLFFGFQMMTAGCSLERNYGSFSDNRIDGHMSHFTKKSMFEIFENYGFKIVQYKEATAMGAWVGDQKARGNKVSIIKRLLIGIITWLPFKKEVSVIKVIKDNSRNTMDKLDIKRELLLCANTQDEGFGSVYERISLGRLLGKLNKKYAFRDVLEYGCKITKGYDNLVFADNGASVSLFDFDMQYIKDKWIFGKKASFTPTPKDNNYDLVWNFAVLQTRPEVLSQMIAKSTDYVLVFTPNIINYGTPFHLVYHGLTRVDCHHAEQGDVHLRSKNGLTKTLAEAGLEIMESGYVDLPWWPDTAFGIRELRQNLFGLQIEPIEEVTPSPARDVLIKIERSMAPIEKNKKVRSGLLKHLFAHHCFVLARKK